MNGFQFPAGMKNGISAAPDIMMGLAFLVSWIDPTALGENMISYLSLVVFLEFIIIHSSAFMGFALFGRGSRTTKIFSLAGLFLFYSIFIIAFSLIYNEWWPLLAFFILVVNRLVSIILGQRIGGPQRLSVGGLWAISVVCYVVGVFVMIALPMPEFGITEDFITGSGVQRSNLWFEELPNLMAFGFFYFTAVGLFELFVPSWIEKIQRPKSSY